jgi:hypothetical protein
MALSTAAPTDDRSHRQANAATPNTESTSPDSRLIHRSAARAKIERSTESR